MLQAASVLQNYLPKLYSLNLEWYLAAIDRRNGNKTYVLKVFTEASRSNSDCLWYMDTFPIVSQKVTRYINHKTAKNSSFKITKIIIKI